MFVSDSTFRLAVAAALKMDVADLGAYWDAQAQRAHQSAYLDIRGALLARGFTAAQVDAWARGEEFEHDIGLFWALVRGGRPAHITEEMLAALDRRAELATVTVEIDSGTPQTPSTVPGRIVAGVLATVDADGNDDRWTRDTVI